MANFDFANLTSFPMFEVHLETLKKITFPHASVNVIDVNKFDEIGEFSDT